MALLVPRIPQPGWTGTRALRIVQAAPRTFSSVDPIGRQSATETSRSETRSVRSSMLRLLPLVSVVRSSIETSGASWRNVSTHGPSTERPLVQKPTKPRPRRRRRSRRRSQMPDPRSTQGRSSGCVKWLAACLSVILCPAVGRRQPRGRARETERDRRFIRFFINRIEDRRRTEPRGEGSERGLEARRRGASLAGPGS